MATIKRTLSSKVDANKKSEIMLRLTAGRGFQFRLRSSLFIEAERFNNGAFGKSRPGSALFNEVYQIEKTLKSIEALLLDICQTEPLDSLTKESLQERVDAFVKQSDPDESEDAIAEPTSSVKRRGRKPKSENTDGQSQKPLDFFEALDRFIELRHISVWRKKRYEVLMRALRRFEMYRKIKRRKEYRLTLDGFTVDDLNDFETFLRKEDELYDKYPKIYEAYPSDTRKTRKKPKPLPKGDNTIINLFACFRSFYKDCIEQELTKNQPFAKYKGTTVEHYGTPYYITLEERNIIAEHDFSQSKSLETQRDIFIFHTLIGCRVSDLYRLTENDVINGAVEYIAQKTLKDRATTIRVPLNQRGLDLIERYRGKDPEGRLFPFISQQKYNKAIKSIFTICGITRMVTILNAATGKEEKRPLNELASSHLARRTFVGNLYKKVKDPNLVGALSGHKEGSRAFARYRDIDEDMKKELIDLLE